MINRAEIERTGEMYMLYVNKPYSTRFIFVMLWLLGEYYAKSNVWELLAL